MDEPSEALRSILSILIENFHAGSGSVSLLNPDTGRLEIEVHEGLPVDAREVSLRPGQGITGWVAFHARPQLVPDVSADPRYISVRPGVRCEMAVPLIEAEDQILGVINLDNDRVGGFSPDDLDQLVEAAAEASLVMRRLWQLRQLRGKARELEALITTGQSFVTKLEPRELFDNITRDARAITQSRACALYLCALDQSSLQLVSLAQPAPAPALPRDLPLDSCLVSPAIHTRRQVEFANIQSPEFLDLVDVPGDPALGSMLATPLAYEGEIIGVLAVFTAGVHRFNNDEKRLLSALAGLGAVALQNTRLYARVFQSEASLRKNEQLTTLGLLAAEIAHEIRNPLTVIKLLYGYLGLEFPEGDPRRHDVRLIAEKIDQLEAIVTRVLNFAKSPTSVHARASLQEIVGDTLVLIRLKLAQGKIVLRHDAAPDTLVVDVHRGQIQQVLLNLLINATQAMPDGGVIALRTFGETRPDGQALGCIEISDTGTGIPAEFQGRIFDSFLSGRSDGTGLGLSIAKRILLSHHGDITLLSTSPAGTTFRISLPLARE